jgi:hypothetical protein
MANRNPATANPYCCHSMKKMDKVLEMAAAIVER